MAATDSTPRIPAWKRLGLKLKFAKDTADSTSEKTQVATDQSTSSNKPSDDIAQSRKRSRDEGLTEASVKRSKSSSGKPKAHEKSFPQQQRPLPEDNFNDEDRSTLPGVSGVFKAPNQTPKRTVFGEDESTERAATQKERPASLKKSVSFTPDTKNQDGFSTAALFKNWTSTEDPGTEPGTESPAQGQVQTKEAKREKKKEKRLKQKAKPNEAKSGSDADDDTTSTRTPVYVEYLKQYHQDRQNWKFNKNKQNDLLRNLFNLHRIPPDLTPTVVEYIAGLKGQARQRVGEEAQEVLKAIWVRENPDADPMSLESAAARKREYYQALARSLQRYDESGQGRSQYGDEKLREVVREENAKGQRAEEILDKALDDFILESNKTTPTPARAAPSPDSSTSITNIPGATRVEEMTATGKTADSQKKRKRKARTEVSSSESSSESSSSESDSSDDSSSEESDSSSEATPPPQTRKPSPPKKEKRAAIPAFSTMFDNKLLDKKFGKAKPDTHNDLAPKRKGAAKGEQRGFAYTHGSKADESESDSD